MATIREIAELAGVSRGTVDRVLNNRGRVKPQTEEKIREIADALQYKPNRAGIVLAARKKKLRLGAVLFGPDHPFFLQVEEGMREKAEELQNYNCSVLLRHVPFDAVRQAEALDELAREGVNGIALSPYNDDLIRKKIDGLYAKGIPTVTLNTDIERSRRIAYVGSDYFLTGETAAGLMNLTTSGQVSVGIVTGSPNVLCHTRRIAGFESRIASAYPNISVVDTVYNHDDEFESYEQTCRLLSEHPEINALFFAAGGVYGGCRALLNSGRQDSVRVITYDSMETTKQLLLQGVIAATICQQPKVQGSLPLDLLFANLTAGELPAQECSYVDVDIRIRETI